MLFVTTGADAKLRQTQEGAIADALQADDGRVASHCFMTHEVLPDQATADSLCYHFLTEHGLDKIRGA